MSGQPTHALFVISNWDGEGDLIWTFAYKKDGVFYHYESDQPVIKYHGDEILKIVMLDKDAIDQPERKRIVQSISDDGLVLEIPTEYLVNSFAMGVTTNVTGKVIDSIEMLEHFAEQFDAMEGDSKFGRFIDAVCEDAIDQGALFVECDDDE